MLMQVNIPASILTRASSLFRPTIYCQHLLYRTIKYDASTGRFEGISAEDYKTVNEWRAKFNLESMPEDEFTFSFSRSSGPGGQNVNKVNTKTELRMTLKNIKWMPEFVRVRLVDQNKNRVNTKGEFIMTSERFRSQLQNRKDCIDKLYALIDEASLLPSKPSQQQVNKIKGLQAKERESSMRQKQNQSSKKSDRSTKGL